MKKLKHALTAASTVALMMLAMGAPSAFAAPATEIVGSSAIGLSNYTDLGAAPADATMNVTVFLKLKHRAQLQKDIRMHKKLTPAQFHMKFSPDGKSYKAVENQLTKAGLTVIGTSDNNMAIDVQGTVSQIESVFGTQIHQFKDKSGKAFLANITDYHVTGALAAHLSGAVGVDQLANPRPLLKSTKEGSTAKATVKGMKLFDGNNSANIQKAYNFDPVYNQGIDGSGQTIAIVDAYGSPTIQSDLKQYQQTVEEGGGAFEANHPLNLTVMAPPGMNVMAEKNKVKGGNAAAWAGEVSMDVELSHAAAPGAHILLVATPNNGSDLYMGVNQVVDKHLANQMSLSFGSPEQYTPASERHATDQIFEQAAAEGINVFVSSGDWSDFTQPPYNLPQPTVSYPASDPNVISVGGSSLFVGDNNSYDHEILWGDTFTSITSPNGTQLISSPEFWAGTGGGTSRVYTKPSWQTGVSGLGSTNMRQVPDVAFDADPYTGFELVINGQNQDGWGGTSDAAPQWAAIAALANEATTNATGHALPFINPILYADGYSQGAFHDVPAGTATLKFTGSSSGNHYTMTMGDDDTSSIQAGPGWDDATGLGTPDVANVVKELVNSQK